MVEAKARADKLNDLAAELRRRAFSSAARCRGAEDVPERIEVLNRMSELLSEVSWNSDASNALSVRRLLEALREQVLEYSSAVRAAALRALRHTLCCEQALREATTLRLPSLVCSRAEASTASLWERVCALRVGSFWLSVATSARVSERASRFFVITLVSLAEQEGDVIRGGALQTLCQAAFALPNLVARCQGLHCLAGALTDPVNNALAQPLVAAFLYAMDDRGARGYASLCDTVPLGCLLAVYTCAGEVNPSPPLAAGASQELREKREARWAAARRGILLLLRSVAGLLALSTDGSGLPALCQLLRFSTEAALKVALLELFGDIVAEFCTRPCEQRLVGSKLHGFLHRSFRLDVAADRIGQHSQACGQHTVGYITHAPQGGSASRLGVASLGITPGAYDRSQVAQSKLRLSPGFVGVCQEVDLLEVYAGLVLRTLLASGLPEALSVLCISEDSAPDIVSRGAMLLAEVNRAAAALLPPHVSETLQESMAPTVAAAVSFTEDPRRRSRADELLRELCAPTTIYESEPTANAPHSMACSSYGKTVNWGLFGALNAQPSATTDLPKFGPSPAGQRRGDLLGGNHTSFEVEGPRNGSLCLGGKNSALATALNYTQTWAGEVNHDRLLNHLQHHLQPTTSGKRTAEDPTPPRGYTEYLHNQLKQCCVVGLLRDDSKWDWVMVQDLLFGPLQHPAGMSEALGTKFFKRLLRDLSPSQGVGLWTYLWRPEHLNLACIGHLALGLLLLYEPARMQILDLDLKPNRSGNFIADLALMFSHEMADCLSTNAVDSIRGASGSASPRRSFEPRRMSARSGSGSSSRGASPQKIRRSRTEDGGGRSRTWGVDELRSHSTCSIDASDECLRTSDTPRSLSGSVGGASFMGFLCTSSQCLPSFLCREQTRLGLAREYASFIGLISSTHEGVELLSKAGVYQKLLIMCAMPSKEYLLRPIITELNYSFEHNRRVLEETLQGGSPILQLNTVRFLALTLLDETSGPNLSVGMVFNRRAARGNRPNTSPTHRADFIDQSKPMLRSKSQEGMARTPSCNSIAGLSSFQKSRTTSSVSDLDAGLGLSSLGTPLMKQSDMLLAGEASHAEVSAAAAAIAAATAAMADGNPYAGLASPSPAQASPPTSEGDARRGQPRWCWIISLLAKAALHSDQRVSAAAIDALQATCRSEEFALELLQCWQRDPSKQASWPPTLRLVLLQTSAGLEALQSGGWLERDSDVWFRHEHYAYVDVVSMMLRAALSQPGKDAAVDLNPLELKAGIPLPPPTIPGAPRLAWLSNVPWCPVLQVERTTSGESLVLEELVLDSVVDQAMPYEFQVHFDQVLKGRNSLSLTNVFNEVRVTAFCDVPLGADRMVTLRAFLSVGALQLDEVCSTFVSARDWQFATRFEGAADCGGTLYVLQQGDFGVLWTFLVGRSFASGAISSTDSKPLQLPPVNCRLISVSWPLRTDSRSEDLVTPGRGGGGGNGQRQFGGQGATPPWHFCSQLARTAGGADFLRRSGYVREYVADVLAAFCACHRGELSSNPSLPPLAVRVRAALWAACNLGQLPHGLELLADYDILKLVVQVASRPSRLSVAGTALYCLAIIGSNPMAGEMLEAAGWDPPTVSCLAAPRCRRQANTDQCLAEEDELSDIDESPLEIVSPAGTSKHVAFGDAHRRVVELLKSLRNSASRKRACAALAELRKRDTSIFHSVPLWLYAQRCIAGRYRQPLQVRRFVAELFEGALDSVVALHYLDSVA